MNIVALATAIALFFSGASADELSVISPGDNIVTERNLFNSYIVDVSSAADYYHNPLGFYDIFRNLARHPYNGNVNRIIGLGLNIYSDPGWGYVFADFGSLSRCDRIKLGTVLEKPRSGKHKNALFSKILSRISPNILNMKNNEHGGLIGEISPYFGFLKNHSRQTLRHHLINGFSGEIRLIGGNDSAGDYYNNTGDRRPKHTFLIPLFLTISFISLAIWGVWGLFFSSPRKMHWHGIALIVGYLGGSGAGFWLLINLF